MLLSGFVVTCEDNWRGDIFDLEVDYPMQEVILKYLANLSKS